MATTRDVQAQQRNEAGWAFDPDQVEVEARTGVDPDSSAAVLVSRLKKGRKAAAKDREEVVDRLQAQRKEREKDRRKTAGLSTAEIIAGRVRRS